MKSEIYLIGGGNSVLDINKSKLEGKDIMAINKSIIDFPDAKYFVTMDHSFLKKLDLKKRILIKSKAIKVFIANLVPDYMEERQGLIVDTRWNIKYDTKLFDMIIKSRAKEGLGYEWNDFRNGYSSAYCALQLAILLGYEKINLVGYDLVAEGQTHYHGGYGESLEAFRENLEEYYKTFKATFMQLLEEESTLKIYNCSKISRLKKLLPYKEI
jgi:hypothetical protein